MENWLSTHWVQIGVIWVFVQNLLKAIQDAEDVEPTDLKSKTFARVAYYMNCLGKYLFLGDRPSSISK